MFAVPGLIFEGLETSGVCGNGRFCQGFRSVNPQRSVQGMLLRNLFWDMLFQKEPETASRSGLSARSV
jgi:hypothetical protein